MISAELKEVITEIQKKYPRLSMVYFYCPDTEAYFIVHKEKKLNRDKRLLTLVHKLVQPTRESSGENISFSYNPLFYNEFKDEKKPEIIFKNLAQAHA